MCRRACSPTPISRRCSIPPTSGSCSGSASASATSPTPASRRRTSARKRRSARSPRAGITPDDIGVIVVGTVTPDMMFPSTACLIQDKIGAHHAWGFDISAACSAFTYSVTTASQLVASGRARLCARRRRRRDVEHHRLHRSLDLRAVRRRRRARSSSPRPAKDDGAILDFEHEIDGSGGAALCMPAGGSRQPPSHETRRSAPPLREAGGADRLQVRGAQDRRDRPPHSRAQRPAAVRPRPVRVASGEPPHHRGRLAEPRGRSRRRS